MWMREDASDGVSGVLETIWGIVSVTNGRSPFGQKKLGVPR